MGSLLQHLLLETASGLWLAWDGKGLYADTKSPIAPALPSPDPCLWKVGDAAAWNTVGK